jgi:hypothetical protein
MRGDDRDAGQHALLFIENSATDGRATRLLRSAETDAVRIPSAKYQRLNRRWLSSLSEWFPKLEFRGRGNEPAPPKLMQKLVKTLRQVGVIEF